MSYEEFLPEAYKWVKKKVALRLNDCEEYDLGIRLIRTAGANGKNFYAMFQTSLLPEMYYQAFYDGEKDNMYCDQWAGFYERIKER